MPWITYINESNDLTLGTAMGLEKIGQGRSPVKSIVKTKDRYVGLARAVMFEYALAPLEGEPISVEVAIERVAKNRKGEFSTIEKAWKENSRLISAYLNDLQLTKQEKG